MERVIVTNDYMNARMLDKFPVPSKISVNLRDPSNGAMRFVRKAGSLNRGINGTKGRLNGLQNPDLVKTGNRYAVPSRSGITLGRTLVRCQTLRRRNMDEVKTEKTPETTHTTITRTTERSSASGATLWFLLGGIVVVIAVIGFFVFGDGVPSTQSAAPTDGDVSVTVETDNTPNPAPEPADAEPTGSDPATAAPADSAPANAEPEVAPQSE
ncbi:hypothetical protein ACSSVY_000482 [Roseovarius sp. MBR-51]